jgi:hypothetical protein
MQPEAIAARFIAAHHRRGGGEPEALFRLSDFVGQPLEVARRNIAFARLLAMPGGEAELPGAFTEFKGQIQDGLGFVILSSVGRCRLHKLPPS